MKWTEQESDLLRKMYKEGSLVTKMSEAFGRSKDAIQDKIRRQRLSEKWRAAPNFGDGTFVAEMALQKPGEVQVKISPRTRNLLLDPPGLDACDKRGI